MLFETLSSSFGYLGVEEILFSADWNLLEVTEP